MIKIFALREVTVQWEGKCISKRLQLRVMSTIDGENPECGGCIKRILSSTLIASDIYRDGKNMRSISSVGGGLGEGKSIGQEQKGCYPRGEK